MQFEKTVTFSGAWDKRHKDPSKNYGIHGVEIRFVLRGERGATQFLIYTNWYLPHVQRELAMKGRLSISEIEPSGADIGYHAYTPLYEDQRPMDHCDILGVPCYYDGSSLRASEFIPQFLAGGSDAVWEMLEDEYRSRFGDTVKEG